jgi:DNA-3-methyladenine glycosylase I
VPRGGSDFIYGDTFPHEADLDQLAGVDFHKGCYVGQEVVSRVEHRASARRRVVPVAYDGPSPMSGAPVMAGEREIGMLGSAAQGRGLALLRLDRVAGAQAGGHAALRRRHRTAGAKALLGHVRLARRDRRVMSALMHADGLARCPWPKQDPLYVAYHDTEWGVPEFDDRALYEKLVLDGFQAGLSWITILRKRENFRKAFDDFAPEKIARYQKRKIEKLMQDAGIVRNRAKIEGTVLSARAYLDIMEKGPGFSALLWDFLDGRPKINQFKSIKQVPAETDISRKMSKELAGRGFKFVGPTIVYAFMQAVGMVNDHLTTCHRHAECSHNNRR